MQKAAGPDTRSVRGTRHAGSIRPELLKMYLKAPLERNFRYKYIEMIAATGRVA
jgi:hypothetical protein